MFTRRKFLQTTAAGGAVLATSGLAAPAIAQAAAVKLGYVSPQTGPLAGFGEADKFVIDSFLATTKKMGLNYEVIVKDSQSNPNRAAEVAKELIVDDEINLMLVSSTPETTNPVSTTCEAEQIPCLSTVAPWQPWFIGQQGNPGDPTSWKPFDFAYHYFWGLEDVIAVFTNMWNQLETNKKVGGLFPNDADGNAWGDPNVGLKPGLAQAGYDLLDPGRYQNLSDDFTAQVNAFKDGSCDIITGVVIPPDFTTFWNQAKQQGLKPKIASIGKALLFPQTVEALGDAGTGGPQSVVRGLVVGPASVQVLPDRSERRRPCRRLHVQDRPPLDPADRLYSLAVRDGDRCHGPRHRCHRCRRHCRRHCRIKGGHDRRPRRMEWPGRSALCSQECHQDAAGRRPVAPQGRRHIRPRHRRQQDGPEHTDIRQDGSLELT